MGVPACEVLKQNPKWSLESRRRLDIPYGLSCACQRAYELSSYSSPTDPSYQILVREDKLPCIDRKKRARESQEDYIIYESEEESDFDDSDEVLEFDETNEETEFAQSDEESEFYDSDTATTTFRISTSCRSLDQLWHIRL